jgi:hypothetical protein
MMTGSSSSGTSGLGVGLVGLSSSCDEVVSEFGVVLIEMPGSCEVLSEFGVVLMEMPGSCDGVTD